MLCSLRAQMPGSCFGGVLVTPNGRPQTRGSLGDALTTFCFQLPVVMFNAVMFCLSRLSLFSNNFFKMLQFPGLVLGPASRAFGSAELPAPACRHGLSSAPLVISELLCPSRSAWCADFESLWQP